MIVLHVFGHGTAQRRLSLRRAISEYTAHYHEERNHQGLENRLIRPTSRRAANTPLIQRHVRLGGMFNYYYRTAV